LRVSESNHNTVRKILVFGAIVEVGTGLALMIDPARVVALLLGASEGGETLTLGRVAGVALFALGLACWPSGLSARNSSSAFRGMLTYNVLIALYLAYLGAVDRLGGVLLWPAVGLHAVVALLQIWCAIYR
jgi:hypothetical protein